MPLDNDFLNLSPVNRTHEIAENNFWFTTVLLAEDAENHQKNQRQD
jgi:hypothetical protein